MNILYNIFIYPISQVIEFIFVFSQNLFKEAGLSIICLSGAVSILCLPLYLVAEKWQETERSIQKRLAPKIAKIKAVFMGDERHMILSTYYRQNHYHPIYAMRSTFGLLIQVPFFIAAYSYLSNLEALQGLPFLFIKDLIKPDMLIPIAGGVNFLPILMTLINCAAAMIYTSGLSKKDKAQLYGIALLFLILLYNSPAGLVLYWTLNNVFSLIKNGYLKLKYRKKHLIFFVIISISALLLSFYTLFLLRGNPRVRILIITLSIIVGILPWISPLFARATEKLNYIFWTSKESFSLFILSILVLWVITGVFLPSMLISASPQEFSFIDNVTSPLFFIINTSVQAFGLLIIWPLMIYFLFSEKVKKILSILMAFASFSALCNIFIFPGSYGPISGLLVFSGNVTHNLREILINVFALIILLVILLFIYINGFKKILSILTIIVFVSMVSFSSKLIYSINAEFRKLSEFYIKENKNYDAVSPLFQLSRTGKNVFVIMLDMAESVFIPYIFEESPELNQKYEGFVYYPNTVTFNGWTEGGAPPIFGGYEYTPQGMNARPDVSLTDKTREALLLMPMLLSSSGFSVTVTDPPYAGGSWIPDLRIYDELSDVNAYITDGVYTDQWLKQNNILLPQQSDVLKRNILWYAIFREIPLAFRQGIYYKGSWCSSFSENRMRLFIKGYAVLDYLSELTGFEPQNDNAAIFITNNTTHERWFLQAPFYRPQLIINDYGNGRFNKEDWYHINAAAIHRLSDYFDFLKSNNAYDNTRIILVSDHAVLDNTFVTRTDLPFHVDQFNPLLLIKDFNAKGEMKTDVTFMSTADVPSIAVKGMIVNPVNPFTDNPVTIDHKSDPLLILIHRVQRVNDNLIDLNKYNSFYIHDNIFNEYNWQRP